MSEESGSGTVARHGSGEPRSRAIMVNDRLSIPHRVRKAGTPVAHTFSSRGFTLALGLFVAVLAVYAVFQSPLFRLTTIVVAGAEHLSAADVSEWTGLEMGANLLEVDVRAVQEALRAHPQVKDARVRRKLPASLVVELEERRPVAYLLAGEEFWALDGDGVALFRTEAMPVSLPLITVDEELAPRAGHRVEHPALAKAVEFAGALRPEGLASLSEVHVTREGVAAYTRDGISVALGTDGDMSDRAYVMQELLAEIERRRLPVSHIDLRHPKTPVFRDKR